MHTLSVLSVFLTTNSCHSIAVLMTWHQTFLSSPPPGNVNSKVLGLDVFIDCSQPGCSWTSGRSPLVS